MKRALLATAAGLLCGLLALLWGWHLWTTPWAAPHGDGGPSAPTRQVRIEPGLSFAAAADTLAARGLLRDARILRWGVRLAGRGGDLRAGLFEIPVGISPRELARLLTEGLTVPVRVTVPEGLEAPATAAILAAALGFDADEFLRRADALARDVRVRRGWLPDRFDAARYDSLLAAESLTFAGAFHWSDGYLAPDTYHFAEGTTAADAAAKLILTQAARLDSMAAGPRSPATADLSAHELLTLASIVEAEARRDDERPLIAAVYTNRLQRGMRLEADPTVAYVTNKRGQRLFYRDLEAASAFNTYRVRGLPPGPIGAPGRACLAAAAQPDTAFGALYFVSDGATGHLFARTHEEHEENVRRFRRLKEAQRRRD